MRQSNKDKIIEAAQLRIQSLEDEIRLNQSEEHKKLVITHSNALGDIKILENAITTSIYNEKYIRDEFKWFRQAVYRHWDNPDKIWEIIQEYSNMHRPVRKDFN